MNAENPASTFTGEDYLEAKYVPWLGITFLVLGALNVLLSVLAMLLSGEFSTTIITGIILSIAGVLYLTRTYFVVAPNRITLYNLIGSAVKRYVYASSNELRLDGSKVYIQATDGDPSRPSTAQKVKIAKWMTRPEDWKRLESIIQKT